MGEQKITGNDVFNMLSIIQSLNGKDYNYKFSYAIAKNSKILEDEIKVINEALKNPTHKDYDEFEKKRIEILEKSAEKDKHGRSVKEGIRYIYTPGNEKKVMEEVKTLKKKYKEVSDDLDKISEENKKRLEQEIRIELYKINLDSFPDISPDKMKVLLPIIQEPEEEKVIPILKAK